jgi:hypothetical protein
MRISSISIFTMRSAAIARLAVVLRYLLKQPLKIASTSEELLDLFEDRYALLEEHTLTSPDQEARAAENLAVIASNGLAPVNASCELSKSGEAVVGQSN